MSLSEKAKLNEPSFCAAWAAGSGSHSSSVAQAYAFVQAFAVGSQLAKVYQLPTSLRITTLTAAQSRMEGLAVLAAMMTHWSGSNETAFNQRLNVSTLTYMYPAYGSLASYGLSSILVIIIIRGLIKFKKLAVYHRLIICFNQLLQPSCFGYSALACNSRV